MNGFKDILLEFRSNMVAVLYDSAIEFESMVGPTGLHIRENTPT